MNTNKPTALPVLSRWTHPATFLTEINLRELQSLCETEEKYLTLMGHLKTLMEYLSDMCVYTSSPLAGVPQHPLKAITRTIFALHNALYINGVTSHTEQTDYGKVIKAQFERR